MTLTMRSMGVFLLAGGLAFGAMCSRVLARSTDVIPLPREIKRIGDDLTLDKDHPLRIVLSGGKCATCKTSAKTLADELQRLGVAISQDGSAKCTTLYMGCATANAQHTARCRKADAMPDPKWGPDGYRLKVSSKEILIAGNNQTGTFYGLQTFRQMLEPIPGGKGVRVECVDIRDWPAMKWRGTMFGLQSPREHERLAYYKMNLLNWEVNDQPGYKTIPQFSGGISLAHIREVAESARRYYVNLTLETQSFGHVSWMLSKFPELRARPNDLHVLRPLHEPTYELIGRIYAELCPLYKTPIYMAGCDEAWGIEEWAKEQGLDCDEVIGKHIQRLADMLREHGKRTMIWGDYLLKHRRAIRWMKPKDFLICDWHYEPDKEYPSVDFFVENGFETLVSPAVVPARPIFPDYERQIPNIRGFIQDGVRRGATGLLNTNWPVSPMPTECYWYGWVCGAEYAWNPTGRSQETFDRVFFKQVYGLTSEQGLGLFRKFARLGTYHRLDQEAAKAPKGLLGDMVKSGWNLVVPKLHRAQDTYIREAQSALDKALEAASPSGAERLKAFQQILDRLRQAMTYMEKVQELGRTISTGTWAPTEGSTDSLAVGLDSIRRVCEDWLGLIEGASALQQRGAARAVGVSIMKATEPTGTPQKRIQQVLGLLDLELKPPGKTVRIRPGSQFSVESDPAKVPAPEARREGWCHFPRSDASASWQFEFRVPGRYRVLTLLRHSAGVWENSQFVRGGRNAAYDGRYGWKLDGEPIKEQWLGKELNPDADEALRWAVLADREFKAGNHTLLAHVTGMNHAIIAEFVFTQDPGFRPEMSRGDIKTK
ncbi:MAG: beta-N-acetylhexosaminidase [Phycisphaerae bacterium]|nr:beta-N-acetylhexosaminidase [Phycisphaerae bacterium]